MIAPPLCIFIFRVGLDDLGGQGLSTLETQIGPDRCNARHKYARENTGRENAYLTHNKANM